MNFNYILLDAFNNETQGTEYECEISGSHGGEYEDGCLLGCCAV
jgi:hypothetical protein